MRLATPLTMAAALTCLTASYGYAAERDTAILLRDGKAADAVFVYDPDGIAGVEIKGAKRGSASLKHQDASPKRARIEVEKLFDGFCLAPLKVVVRDGKGNEQSFEFSTYGGLVQMTTKSVGYDPVFSFEKLLPALRKAANASLEPQGGENINYVAAELVSGPDSKLKLVVTGELHDAASSGYTVLTLGEGLAWRFELYVEAKDEAGYRQP